MNDNLILGMALGFVIGAILVRNNQKVNSMIEDGKQKVIQTVDKL